MIVESPAKAKTIGKYLGKRYMVKASMGHVRDLPKSQMGVDVDHEFAPHYITIRGKGEVIKSLRDASKKAKKVFLAADPDREGEAIAWHLSTLLDVDPNQACRVVFHEITKDAVKAAFERPRPLNFDLIRAQQTRRILDRLVGYRLSPLLWKKVKKGLSAGRVQSVAVRLIVDREREIRGFQAEEYWTVDAVLGAAQGKLKARFYGYDDQKVPLPNQSLVTELLTRVGRDTPFIVERLKRSERHRNPSPPFITSSLQQEAARKLSFRAYRTMAVAQQLYEGLELGGEGSVGLITYMRTDSVRLADSAQQEVRELIVQKFGPSYLPDHPKQYSSKGNAQDAHEAIRPTSVQRYPEDLKPFLSKDQYRLYKLIWERFVASQMMSAVLDTTVVDLSCKGAWFRANGSVMKFPGYTAVYTEGHDDAGEEEGNRLLPPLQEGEALQNLDLFPEQHFTQPPPRYSESSLVKAMEELGIGRPSTYAPTIETILKRGYAILDQRRFFPTELGEIVVDLLVANFHQVIDVDFTAHLEEQLDKVEDGDADGAKILSGFYDSLEQDLSKAESTLEHVQLKEEVSDVQCEKCGRMMVYKHGRYGKFLACPGFPECRNTKPILKEVGVNCPICQKPLVERKGKRKTFYGCSGYPECDYVLWNRPSGALCPICQHPMVEKKVKGKIEIVCSNEKAHTTVMTGGTRS